MDAMVVHVESPVQRTLTADSKWMQSQEDPSGPCGVESVGLVQEEQQSILSNGEKQQGSPQMQRKHKKRTNKKSKAKRRAQASTDSLPLQQQQQQQQQQQPQQATAALGAQMSETATDMAVLTQEDLCVHLKEMHQAAFPEQGPVGNQNVKVRTHLLSLTHTHAHPHSPSHSHSLTHLLTPHTCGFFIFSRWDRATMDPNAWFLGCLPPIRLR